MLSSNGPASKADARAIDPRLTLNALLDESAARFPNRIALVTADQSFDYARLRERVRKAAAAFRARGVRKGDSVALVLRNGPEFVVAYFALARLGAVAVPVNFLVTKPEELRFMLEDSGAVGVVTQREFLKGLLPARKDLPRLRWLWSRDGEQPEGGVEDLARFVDAGDAEAFDQGEAAPDDVAAILYTSGTTGLPKGVMLSHANMVTDVDACLRLIGFTERDVILCILPMFHTFAWTANVLASLRLGAKLVVCPAVAPPMPWLKLMAKHRVTLFTAVPPVYTLLAKEVKGFKGLALKHWFFRRVKLCVSGAGPLPLDTADTFGERMGIPIIEGYGLTETSPVVTINPPRRPKKGSVGPALDGMRLRVIDEAERELPPGIEGEICVQGPCVMLGYRGRPEATQDTFTSDGWFKTGDIGILDDDGYLFIRDRKKDMIIVKGLKVFSAQVEQVLITHPDVAEAAIVGVPEGNGEERIKAYLVLRDGAAPDKAALMRFCREHLDTYKRPRDIEIVSALPKNALQKVLKRVLRQQAIEKRQTL